MRQLLLFPILAVGLMSTAMAKPTSCNYRDFIHVSNTAPANTTILQLSNSSGVTVQQTNTTSFFILDQGCPPDGGYVFVRYGTDPANYCDLSIHDGELMWDPNVVANCTGNFVYNGTTYDGTGSYSYTLLFSAK